MTPVPIKMFLGVRSLDLVGSAVMLVFGSSGGSDIMDGGRDMIGSETLAVNVLTGKELMA